MVVARELTLRWAAVARKLTKTVENRIVEVLEAGHYLKTAAELSGVGYSTVREWIERGEGAHPDRPATPEFAAFAAACAGARARGEEKLLAIVIGAAADEWRAAAWILERAFPERWAERREVELRADVTVTPVFTDERAQAVLELLREEGILAGLNGDDD